MESGSYSNNKEEIVELQEIELKHATKEIPDSIQESEKKIDENRQSTIPTQKQPPIEEV